MGPVHVEGLQRASVPVGGIFGSFGVAGDMAMPASASGSSAPAEGGSHRSTCGSGTPLSVCLQRTCGRGSSLFGHTTVVYGATPAWDPRPRSRRTRLRFRSDGRELLQRADLHATDPGGQGHEETEPALHGVGKTLRAMAAERLAVERRPHLVALCREHEIPSMTIATSSSLTR